MRAIATAVVVFLGAVAPAVAQQNQALDTMAKPVAEVILAAVRPVKTLVNKAGTVRVRPPGR